MNRLFPIALCALLAGCQPATENAQTTEIPVEASDSVQKTPVQKVTEVGPVHAVVELSNENPTLGEPIDLTLRVTTSSEIRITMPEFGDQLGKFSIADYKSTETPLDDGRIEYTQKYTLDLPMSGKLRTPSFLIEFVDNRADSEQKDKIQELLTEEITFDVASVFADGQVPEELAPPKDALPELVLPTSSKNNLWIYILLGILAVSSAGIVIWRKKCSKREIILPPDVVALSEITRMESQVIPSDSEGIDAWYVQLSSIVRNYVEGRFALHAPRLTTEEFFELAKKNDALKDTEKELICRLLERSDRVKFSDFIPTENESRQMLADARRFVEETRIVPEQESDTAKTAN